MSERSGLRHHGARRFLAGVLPPLGFGVAFVALWEAVVRVFDLKPYFLSAPSKIWQALLDNAGRVWDAAFLSGSNALVGLLVGTALGIAMSFVLMRFELVNKLVTPLAIALNAIPIVVLVSVFNNMYPTTSEIPRRLMVTVVVYFIVLVNVAKGLRQVSPTHLELMRSYAASPMAILLKTRIPNAVPYLFTALKVAAPVSVITAFVAEYFGGNQNGLGFRITSNSSTSKNTVSWAYVVGAMALGLTFYLVSIALESFIASRRGLTPGEGNP